MREIIVRGTKSEPPYITVLGNERKGYGIPSLYSKKEEDFGFKHDPWTCPTSLCGRRHKGYEMWPSPSLS